MTDSNCITVLTSNKLTMTSREVAELTNKEHKTVLRDIRSMLITLYGKDHLEQVIPDQYRNRHAEYIREHSADILNALFDDGTNRFHQEKQGFSWERDTRGYISLFHLDKSHTLTLVSGYDVALRKRIIDRWQELEAQQITLPDFTRPAEAARAWAVEYERAEQHRLAHAQAQQQLEAQAPAVAFHKQVTDNSETLLRIEEACALLKRKTGQNFNQTTWLRFLREQGIAKLQNKYSGIGPKTFVPKAAYVNHWFVSTMTEGGNTLWLVRPVAVEQIFQRIEQQHQNVDLLAPIARQLMARIS